MQFKTDAKNVRSIVYPVSTGHSFSATFFARSAEEAEAKAHDACRRYFGSTPYVMTLLDADEVRTTSDRVIGYQCDVRAEGGAVNAYPPEKP